ncbi:MAG: hypothetical protein AAF368_00150 [Planctomycetota bacterium]
MSDFEIVPIGTLKRLKELEAREVLRSVSARMAVHDIFSDFAGAFLRSSEVLDALGLVEESESLLDIYEVSLRRKLENLGRESLRKLRERRPSEDEAGFDTEPEGSSLQ